MTTDQKVASRTERPSIKPFVGSEELDALAKGVTLRFDETADVVPEGGTIHLDPRFLEHGGVRLMFGWAEEDLNAAVSSLGISPDKVDVIVITESKLLGARDIVKRESLTDASTEPGLVLAPLGGELPPSMHSVRNGYDIYVYFVLNDELDGTPITPRRLGTILSQSVFRVRSDSGIGGLTIYPLTAEKRKEESLPGGTLMYVEPQTVKLIEATRLEDAMILYLDDKILGLLQRDRGEVALMAERFVFVGLMTQLLAMASIELANEESVDDLALSEDGATLALVRLVKGIAKQVKLKDLAGASLQDERKLLKTLKDTPERVFAAATVLSEVQRTLVLELEGNAYEVET